MWCAAGWRRLPLKLPWSSSRPHDCPHLCPAAGSDTERSDAVAVGTWGMEAQILTLPGLKPLFKEVLPTDVIPRRWASRCSIPCCCIVGSVHGALCRPVLGPPPSDHLRLHPMPPSPPPSTLFVQFEGDTYLLYGLGDGQLVNYR